MVANPSSSGFNADASQGASFYFADLIDEPLTLEDLEVFLAEERANAELWNSAAAGPTADPAPPPHDYAGAIVSVFENTSTTFSRSSFAVWGWVQKLRDGYFSSLVEPVRAATHGSGEYRHLKAQLPAVAWAGEFERGRKGTSPCKPSGLVFAEIDQKPSVTDDAWLKEQKARLSQHPCVLAVYRSAGGAGLHTVTAVSPIPQTSKEYKVAWAAVSRELGIEKIGDPAVSNRTRLALCSVDAELHYNPNPAPLLWELNKEEGEDEPRHHKPETLAEAFRLIAEHFGVEWSGSSDDDCRDGLRMPCTFHGGSNPTSLSIRLEEREIAGRRGATKMVAFVAATCFSRGCNGPSVLRYIAKEVGFVWPMPIAGGEAIVQEFLSTYPHRLAVVDRAKLYVRREAGLWVDGTRPNPTGTAAIQGMLKEMGGDGPWNQRQIDELRTSLFYVMERPGAYGIAAMQSDDFDRAPLFPLRAGGSIDARTLEILDNDKTAGAYMMDQSSPGIDYQPELLNAGPDHPGVRLAMHFEPDPASPRYQLLRRFGYLLLGPTKAVDSIIMPLSDSGKSTFARWLSFALPGYVSLVDAVVALSAQGTRFTAVQHRLSIFRLVILDEADKIEKPPSAGAFNALTADTVTVELKGKDSIEAPRRGNAVMIGAGPPNLELGQGGRERLGWAFDGSGIGKMSAELRQLIDDPEAQGWLATKLLTLAAEAHRTGDKAADSASRAAAAVVHQQTANPLQSAIADCLELDNASSVWLDAIKERLAKYPDVSQPIPARTLGSAMQMVFGSDMKSIPTTRERKPARYYPGVRLT